MGKATGFIEVFGLTAAFVAVDAGCKAANVTVETLDKNKPGNADALPVPLIICIKFRGSVEDVKAAIEAAEVADKAPFVDKFTTEYHDCEVIATVDKASGNVTHIIYIVSVDLELTVSMFGKHDVAAGLTFEKDYTITY